MRAPELPTTIELQTEYGLSFDAAQNVQNERGLLAEDIDDHEAALIAIVGVCAAMNTPRKSVEEADRLMDELGSLQGLRALKRNPFWKPRSNPQDWHGLETTEPEAAYRISMNLAERHGNLSAEISQPAHLVRYGAALTLGWTGGRNAGNQKLLEDLALMDPTLPLAIKNSLDGNIHELLRTTALVNEARGETGAPAVPLYRGGTNAQTPSEWRDTYLRALDLTEGRLIVDVAHGSEMAHDSEGRFQKSVGGQIRAMETVIELAERGYAPLGIMLEASDLESPTDPVMPLDIALAGCQALYRAKVRELVAA